MNLPTRRDHAVWKRVTAYQDPAQECFRRWPSFRFISEPKTHPTGKVYIDVKAVWKIEGEPHGLRIELASSATFKEIENAERLIAIRALVNDEYRKLM